VEQDVYIASLVLGLDLHGLRCSAVGLLPRKKGILEGATAL